MQDCGIGILGATAWYFPFGGEAAFGGGALDEEEFGGGGGEDEGAGCEGGEGGV